MKLVALPLLLTAPLGAPVAADELLCRFADAPDISFGIDRTQFAPPVDPNDPPRRKVSRIRLGPQSFVAEPILMAGGTRGFWTDDPVTGTHVLTIRPDGTATYSGPDGSSSDGICEDIG